jgi:hypothetical protein
MRPVPITSEDEPVVFHNVAKALSWKVGRRAFDITRVEMGETKQEASEMSGQDMEMLKMYQKEFSFQGGSNTFSDLNQLKIPIITEIRKEPAAPKDNIVESMGSEVESKKKINNPLPVLAESMTSPVHDSNPSMPTHTRTGIFDTSKLILGALGIVFGDIGTSPLYTVQTIFTSVPVTRDNVIGAISSIFWLLNISVTLKYVTVIMRANNRGEGGIVALTALASQTTHTLSRPWWKTLTLMIGEHPTEMRFELAA